MSWYAEKIEDAKKVIGEKGLSTSDIEAIYRYQEMKYRMNDVRNHLDEDFDWDDYYGVNIATIYDNDEEITNIAELFLESYQDCNIDENTAFAECISNYLSSYRE